MILPCENEPARRSGHWASMSTGDFLAELPRETEIRRQHFVELKPNGGADRALGLLAPELAEAIARGAEEVAEGKMDRHFVVDVFQTGSGTSSHMNANEVIAKRANELLTGRREYNRPVHPNDHVNLGQS